ncbi:MAG: Gfo/Idh/MocA family oxidoreductase [Candidatus Hydrogenedentes bacterium]|nr:Gfo/Idh/MocA family oxidoreductase [Candidatus Hydrogenedentota bacterium]
MGIRATLLEEWGRRNGGDAPPIENPIRLGVAGLGSRALGCLHNAVRYDDYAPVAACDIRPALAERARARFHEEYGVDLHTYTDFDEMLAKEELDAVAVHVDADKQAPLICRALDAGLHVMAEVPLAYTIADCERIVRSVEQSGKVFLLMEQTRFWGFIRAWHTIVQSGVIGTPIYVEGEYIGYYPDLFFQDDDGAFWRPEETHTHPEAAPTWRQKQPPICYLPHTLSPLLYVLEDRVERVVGMSTRAQGYRHPEIRTPDIQVALMHTEKDAVMKVAAGFTTPVIHRGGTSHHWYHIKGSEGAVEWSRAEWDKPKLWIEGWETPEAIAMPWTRTWTGGPRRDEASGHGGSDFYVYAQFADAVLRGVPAELDVYKAVDTAAPAILAATSIAEGSMPQDVPDYRPKHTRR